MTEPYVTAVEVVRADWTIWSRPRSMADMFKACVLTISSLDSPDDPVSAETFEPDEWRSVTVYGPDGFADFSFDNPALTA